MSDMKREACRLRSTFQQCEALCLQPSGPPKGRVKCYGRTGGISLVGSVGYEVGLGFRRICLH